MMDSNISNTSISAGQSVVSQNRVNLKVVSNRESTVKVENPKRSQSQKVEVNTELRELEQKEVARRLESSVRRLNEFVQSVQRDLQFSIDDLSGETVIKVLDTRTEKVIRQIPAEAVLAISQHIESLKGVLFSAEV